MTTKTTPVVNRTPADKKEECCCCNCHDTGCSCGCQSPVRTILLCGSILVSAALIASTIMFKPCPQRDFMPMPLRPVAAEGSAKDLDKKIQKFIEKNPQILIQAADKYYKAQEAAATKAAQAAAAAQKPAQVEFDFNSLKEADAALVKQVVEDKTNYSLGNKDGKFVIIEFFDYNCGWCKRTNKAMEEVVASDAGKNIRWIPIDTPIFGESSELIARYVLAAGEQGKYAEMHKAVGEAQGRLDEAALTKIATDLKLDAKKLKADAEGKKIKDKLASNAEFREKLNIHGVPMLIVNGRINPGALLGERLDAVVKLAQ